MARPTLLHSFAVLAGLATAGPAFAECAPFTLTSDSTTRTVDHFDAGHGGPGDLRIGSRLVKLDGQPKGETHWVGVLLGSGEDAPVLFNRVWRLDDGEIHASHVTNVVSPPADTSEPSIAGSDAVIIGGTGSYAGANGTVSVDLESTSVTYIFEIECE
ncbi:MAG: hypothetical protein AAF724_09435 [Pseudomonadota bacterium]